MYKWNYIRFGLDTDIAQKLTLILLIGDFSVKTAGGTLGAAAHNC